jgi:hypothetical protein
MFGMAPSKVEFDLQKKILGPSISEGKKYLLQFVDLFAHHVFMVTLRFKDQVTLTSLG